MSAGSKNGNDESRRIAPLNQPEADCDLVFLVADPLIYVR